MPRRLLLLNGLAILSVIVFHAAGWGFTAMFAWPHRYLPVSSPNYDQVGTIAYYALRGVEQLVVFSIPAFLFVSGYFMAFSTERNRPTVSWKIIRTRIQTLLIPYVVWSALLWFGLFLQGERFSSADYARFLLTGATNPAYYFVILLVQFYLLSPFLVPLARSHWKLLLLVSALVQIVVDGAQYFVVLGVDVPVLGWLPKWFFPVRLFWFVFGMVFGFQLTAFKMVMEKGKWVSLAAMIALFVLGVLEWEFLLRRSGQPWIENRQTLLDGLYGGAFILCFLGFTDFQLPFSAQLNDWGGKSFGIYINHSPVMEYVSRGLYHFAPWVLGQQIVLQPMLIVLGLGSPLLLMSLVRKSPARGLYAYLFG